MTVIEKVWLIVLTIGYVVMGIAVLGLFVKKKKTSPIKASDIFDADSLSKVFSEMEREAKNMTDKLQRNIDDTKQSAIKAQLINIEGRILSLEHQPKYKGKVIYKGECYRVLKTEVEKELLFPFASASIDSAGHVTFNAPTHVVKYTIIHNTKDIQVTAFESELKPWKK